MTIVEHQMNAYAKKQTHLTAKAMPPTPGGSKRTIIPFSYFIITFKIIIITS